MIEQWQDFIYHNDDALNKEQVAEMISHFEKNGESIATYRSRTISNGGILPSVPTHREDYVYFMSSQSNPIEHIQWVNETLDKCLAEYLQKYRFLNDGRQVSWRNLKWHTVSQHGGYHSWHYEQGTEPERHLVWHLSMTDHTEEGELEFLYLGHRIEPKAGRMLIFPAGFTHTHRGNPIRKDGQKHYLTGWLYMP